MERNRDATDHAQRSDVGVRAMKDVQPDGLPVVEDRQATNNNERAAWAEYRRAQSADAPNDVAGRAEQFYLALGYARGRTDANACAEVRRDCQYDFAAAWALAQCPSASRTVTPRTPWADGAGMYGAWVAWSEASASRRKCGGA